MISDVLPDGRKCYNTVTEAVFFAKLLSGSDKVLIRVYDEAGNVIETHKHKGDFKEW